MKIKTTDKFNKVAAERMQAIGEFYQLGKRKSYDVSVSIVTVPHTKNRFKITVKLPFDIPIYFERIDDCYGKSEAYRIYKGVHTPEDLAWLEKEVLSALPENIKPAPPISCWKHLNRIFEWRKDTPALLKILKNEGHTYYYEVGNHILKCDLENDAVLIFTYPHSTEPPLFSQSLYHGQNELFVKECVAARNLLYNQATKI